MIYFLGGIGGIMGLFLGASILTVFEFFDVLVQIILTCLGIRKGYVLKCKLKGKRFEP